MRKACHRNSAFLNSPFSSAFSLIEVIIGMVIIGILAMTVIIKFSGVDSQNTRIAAHEICSHLTYARNMAMNHERATRVVFNIGSNNYTVWVDTSGTGSFAMAKDPVTQKDWIVDLSNKFSDVTFSSVNINGDNTLYFSETNGMPLDINRTMLTNNGIIAFKNSTLRITITRLTGHIDLTEKKITLEPIEPEPLEPEPLP